MTDKDTELHELRARVADLETRLNKLAPKPKPTPPSQHAKSIDLARIAREGSAEDQDYERRMAERRKSEDLREQGLWEERTRGLPPGQWRDPHGIIRDRDGRVAAKSDDAAALKKEWTGGAPKEQEPDDA